MAAGGGAEQGAGLRVPELQPAAEADGSGERGAAPAAVSYTHLVEQALLGDEAVELAQHGGPVVERQALAGKFVLGGEQLALGEHKGAALFVAAQLSGAEDPAAQHDATFCINAIPISLILSKNKKYATIIAFIAVITTPPAATSFAIFAFG